MTIKQQILKFLQGKDFVFGGIIDRAIGEMAKCKESNVSRRCRELANESKIEDRKVKFNGKIVVQYRIKQFNPLMGIPARELDLYLTR